MIPKIVVTLALMAVQTAMTMSQKIKGPRLDSLKTTTADYGTPIPRFWGTRKFECPLIHAEDLKETQHTSKTKGGKNTQYKYFATFATLICDHEIDAITRVWMDDKLVYQTTAAGPVSVGAAAGLTVGGTMRIYTGTETQLPDPRYESWCDDRYGANSAPAYRGSAYVFFEDLPVNSFGNRIPNVTIEAVSSKTTVHPYEQINDSGLISWTEGAAISPNGDWMIRYSSGGMLEWWDLANRTLLGTSVPPSGYEDGNLTNIDLASDGTAYWIDQFDSGGSAFSALYICSPLGAISRSAATDAPWFSGPTRVFDTADGRFVYSGVPHDHTGYCSNGGHVADAFCGCDFALKADGVVYGLFEPTVTSNQVVIIPLSGAGAGVAFTGTMRSTPNSPSFCHVASQNHWFVVTDGNWYTVDDTTGAIKASGAFSAFTNNLPRNNPTAEGFWSGYTEISLTDGSTLETVSPTTWVSEDNGTGETLYAPVHDGLIIHPQFASHITIRYLNRIGSNGVMLQTVVDSVAGWCGLTGQDSSALTQTVLGYSVSQGTGKDMIGPLLDIHDVDCRPHDFTVQFVNRGASPSGTILTGDFVRSGSDPRYTVTIQQDTDLPRKLTFNFADIANEQQANNAIAQRPFDAVDTTREETVDLSTYADTVDGAQQKADRYLRRAWNSREGVKNALTAQYLALEPGDKKTLSLDGSLRNVKLNKLTIAQDGLKCEWVRDEAAVAALNPDTAGATADNNSTQTIYIPPLTKGLFLDGPLVKDVDNDVNPGLYYAAGTFGGSSPGAVIYENGSQIESVTSANIDTWGLTTTALASANPNLWDRGNSVNVTVFGTLTSSTEAAINADTSLNLIALGDYGRWEYIQFATATLTGTSGAANLYTLSDLKRGRRGTEGNVGNHAAGDQLWLLSKAASQKMGSDNIGDSLAFQAQTLGRDPDAAPTVNITFAGNTLKPYAPARIEWTTDGTDMFGTIIRRTRLGGAWVGGSTIPLSEASEAYSVDIYHAGVLKRTIAVTGTNTFTYTGAQITADGNTLGVPPSVHAYQLSDAVGRGFALAA